MTDHKQVTLDSLVAMNDYTVAAAQSVCAQVAQVHATLYLAEQQRIANLIALATSDDLIDPVTGTWENGFHESARKAIVEGLGLS